MKSKANIVGSASNQAQITKGGEKISDCGSAMLGWPA